MNSTKPMPKRGRYIMDVKDDKQCYELEAPRVSGQVPRLTAQFGDSPAGHIIRGR